jgi:hypothetical protein
MLECMPYTNQEVFNWNGTHQFLLCAADVKAVGKIEEHTHVHTYICCKCTYTSVYVHAYFYSIIKYGIIFWGNSSNSGKIFTSQKKIVRITAAAQPGTSLRSLFKQLNLFHANICFHSWTSLSAIKKIFKQIHLYTALTQGIITVSIDQMPMYLVCTPFNLQLNLLCVEIIYDAVSKMFTVFHAVKLGIFVYLWLVPHPIVFVTH